MQQTRYRGHRYPPEIISHAIWLYESTGLTALPSQGFGEESPSGAGITTFLDEQINDIAVLIHCSPKVVHTTIDPDENLIDMPCVAWAPLSSLESSLIPRAELQTPAPD